MQKFLWGIVESVWRRLEVAGSNPCACKQAVRQQYDRLVVLDTLNEVFYTEHGFSGDTDSYYHLDNCFVHTCISRRKGLPLTLCALYRYS